ncbi:hypothetical protein BV22DRAFT_1094269 [Leucogyrophana mollusca]|uniref:Uncharacterized protein n=1 Tax=Leucogyrophana mollusca TaxID=85980 RepID=A0ACB8B9Z4_9AGAM|nr:hypothetical protein BV22DRAFT_1094269 [Leucogyrophana mollusca]
MRREARAPFDTAKADIILCSSDNVYFRVFRCLLALASPFFDAMFDLPQSRTRPISHNNSSGLEIIPMTENSRTIDMLLRFCYPSASISDPKMEKIGDVEQVLEAATKYAMEGVEQKVRKVLVAPRFLEKEPLRVFAIAYRYHLEPEARAAAKYLLRLPSLPPDAEELGYIAPNDLAMLDVYRRKCSQAVLGLTSNLEWVKRSQTHRFYEWWTDCCHCRSKSDVRYMMHSTYAREWWVEYMEETMSALKETPCALAVTKRLPKAVEKANGCPTCRKKASANMAEFTKMFAEEIDKAIADVSVFFVAKLGTRLDIW